MNARHLAVPLTAFDKMWDEHVICRLGADADLLQIDRLVLHELSGSQAVRALSEAGRRPMNPTQIYTLIEHLISTRPGRGPNESPSASGPIMIETTRRASREWGFHFIDYDDPRQGIAHVVAPELGMAFPGATLVCCDSHTSTVGGVGAIAFGIGASEAEHVLATQTLAQSRPRTMRVDFDGALPPGVFAKDMVMALIARVGAQGGIGFAAEYTGSAIRSLPVEGRLTVCNMSIEFSCKYGFVPADDVTLQYLAGREFSPRGAQWDAAVAHWQTLRSDEGAAFDREVRIDCASLAPQISWGTSPQQCAGIDQPVPDPASASDAELRQLAEKALAYMQLQPGRTLEGLHIDVAYIGSCTNARLSDLREAASILRGRKVRPGLQALCVPGSTQVKRDAEAEGLDRVFREAGFEWLESACGFCGHIGDDRFADLRVLSTTNRNFEGRQGPRTRTHIASPATVAASAIAGCIADPRKLA
ncbi:3-isopropylmalate dehydratase large subunit [Pseudacidovorax sp. RU35E]|uniref:3-isopropylmalate dehydratase large subunit n=1 Tax=Pseudacidovorax sp. RU35E TaxID=1907403 RepID=UPI000955AB36|nr:3-isopropylmalate dehydratase large subunit [Pseudacidovorax sp. RU35E]SIQ51680.1 3-isopropylmalate/(R)-2-methylmalate dehydratase large subunit [Pseudacidovorax sp. RU35E]